MSELPTAETVTMAGRVKTPSGGHALTDEVYNQRWFARLMKRTTLNDRGCFIWQGPLSSKGYIMFAHRKWRTQAHRIVYRLTHRAELKTEELVCHDCDDRKCWNPGHLFLGTAKINNNDCAAKGRHHNAVKTHCKHGHEFTPENTYLKITPTTTMRACKACDTIKNRLANGWTLEEAKSLAKIPFGYSRKRLALTGES